MSSTLVDSSVDQQVPPLNPSADDSAATHELPDATVLVDRIPPSIRLTGRGVLSIAVIGAVYVIWSLTPIAHTDIWGHLDYGRWIVAQRQVPTTEPLLPLSRNMPWVDTAWFSQILLYATATGAGLAGLQGLFGGLIALAAAMLWRQASRGGSRYWTGCAAMIAFLWLASSPLSILRPQLFGLIGFLYVLAAVQQARPRRTDWGVIPAIFALWANLHGSFPMGLGLLGAAACGALIDGVWRTGAVRQVRLGHGLRWGLLAQLGLGATLLNPYGLKLWAEVWNFSSSPNLKDLLEWQPFDLRSSAGTTFVLAIAALALLYRQSPRRVRSWEFVALVGLTLACCWSYRCFVWWSALSVVLAARHVQALVAARFRRRAAEAASPRGLWLVVGVGVCWITFAFSPLGVFALHQRQPELVRAVDEDTPIEAVRYLHKNPPRGLVFNTYEWGDYLHWAGPRGMQLLLNSHAHLAPREIWQSYMQVVSVGSGWDELLDRLGVNTVVLDTRFRSGLIRKLKEDPRFKLAYEDRQAAIFTRLKPL